METAFRCRLRGPLAHYQHGKLDPEHLYINLHILHTLLYKFLKYHLGESFNKASWVGDRFFYSHDRNALFISISAGRNEKLIRVWRVHQSRYRISSLSYFLVPSSRHSRTKPLSFTPSHKQLQSQGGRIRGYAVSFTKVDDLGKELFPPEQTQVKFTASELELVRIVLWK